MIQKHLSILQAATTMCRVCAVFVNGWCAGVLHWHSLRLLCLQVCTVCRCAGSVHILLDPCAFGVLHHDTLLHVHVPLASICMAVGGVAVPRTTG
jgi:hypothetical protein